MTSTDRTQELNSRVSALNRTLEKCLAALALAYGPQARQKLEALRDEVISEFKSSADRERQHAKVVRPAIQTIELAFEEVLRDLANDDVKERA
jgi:hypothetical protein